MVAVVEGEHNVGARERARRIGVAELRAAFHAERGRDAHQPAIGMGERDRHRQPGAADEQMHVAVGW
jgi:hypothetical protein